MQRKYKELYTILNLANEKDLDDKSNGSITNPFYNINHFYGSTSFLFFPLAIIIATGYPHINGKNTELIDLDLSSNGKVCQNLEYPIQVGAATGGVIDKNTVLVCGGRKPDATDACYVLGNKHDVPVTRMTEKRRRAASVVFKGRLFVSGGRNKNNARLKTTEWIDVHNGSTTGGDLPIPLSSHSMEVIQTIPSLSVMVIGGWSDDGISKKTYFGNPLEQEWTSGPDLIRARSSHASAIINEDDRKFIIVSGGRTTGSTITTTVEFLELTSSVWQWKPGKLFLVFLIDAYQMCCLLY